MNQSSASVTAAAAGHAAHVERKWFVRLAMLAAAGLYVFTVGVIFYRWATSVEPSTVVIVLAAESLCGAEVTVEGLGIRQPYHATIGDRDRYAVPFFLDPGIYTVRVTKNQAVLFQGDVAVQRHVGRQLDLRNVVAPPAPPATGPATRGATTDR